MVKEIGFFKRAYILTHVLKTAILTLIIVLFNSCESKKNETSESTSFKLFQEVLPSFSNIHFTNNVEATKDLNLYKYMYFYNGGGVAAGDLNNDGLDDVYFTGNQTENKLYINAGGFKFHDITSKSGTSGSSNAWYTGVVFTDVNGDGKLDIYVGQANLFNDPDAHNLLFINQGNDDDGHPMFKESAVEMGLTVAGATTQSAFFDYDLDGDLDAYIMTHSNFNNGVLPKADKRLEPSPYGDKLFRNDSGTFVDVTEKSGIYSSILGFGLGINTSDINKDGYPDIYIGNDFYEDDYLYINNGDGTFSEKLGEYIQHTSRFSMGNDVADMNNDGLPDVLSLDMRAFDPKILKASHGEDSYPIFEYKLSLGYDHQYAHNTFQLNRNGTHFSEISHLSGIEATDWSWSVLANDFDLDGHKDVFITNGIFRRSNDMDYMQYLFNEEIQKQLRSGNYDYGKQLTDKMPSYPLRNFFYKNNKDLTFLEVSEDWGSSKKGFSNGATWSDLDRDGDLDLIVNNINEVASIMENKRIDAAEETARYLTIDFKGTEDNPFGIGTKVNLVSNGKKQYKELLGSRGYLSSVPPYLNFGIPTGQNIDTIQIEWPNGKKEVLTHVEADQRLTVYQSNASSPISTPDKVKEFLFKKLNSSALGVSYTHQENRFYEFNREHLIPHMNSTWGPPIAVGDLNNDGLEDFFVGGAQNQSAEIYFQNKNGNFNITEQSALQSDASSEDTAATLFDVDDDGDLDLLVGSGSNQEIKPETKSLTRLYLNTGKGIFNKHLEFPEIYASVSCLSMSDFDKDGDLDVFIGVRSMPGKYGAAPDSYLLENDGKGSFNISSQSDKLFAKSGMVTASQWVDLDDDGWKDLVVVGEWMPIKIHYNKEGKLQEANLEKNNLQFSNGLWNTLEYGDFDNDGDLDLIAGNLGLNANLRASAEEPVKMYHTDFDKNGWPEGIITHFLYGKEHVFHSKSTLEKQLSYLQRKFPTYAAFAQADLTEIFPREQLQNASTLKCYELKTCLVENMGNQKFAVRPLPKNAQFSMVNAVQKLDYNNDGKMDLLLGENLHGVNTDLGRYDAGYGVLMTNKGSMKFSQSTPTRSGFMLNKEVRHIKTIKNQKHGSLLMVANNNDSLLFYARSNNNLQRRATE